MDGDLETVVWATTSCAILITSCWDSENKAIGTPAFSLFSFEEVRARGETSHVNPLSMRNKAAILKNPTGISKRNVQDYRDSWFWNLSPLNSLEEKMEKWKRIPNSEQWQWGKKLPLQRDGLGQLPIHRMYTFAIAYSNPYMWNSAWNPISLRLKKTKNTEIKDKLNIPLKSFHRQHTTQLCRFMTACYVLLQSEKANRKESMHLCKLSKLS